MVCYRCGKQIRDDISFCPYCGAATKQGNTPSADYTVDSGKGNPYFKASKTNKVKIVGICAVVGVLILAILFIVLLRNRTYLLISKTYNDGRYIRYAYDQEGRLIRETEYIPSEYEIQVMPDITIRTYNEEGKVFIPSEYRKGALPEINIHTYRYMGDKLAEKRSYCYSDSLEPLGEYDDLGNAYNKYEYVYDIEGMLVSEYEYDKQTGNSSSSSVIGQHDYTYDMAGHLINDNYYSYSSLVTRINYEYDDNGNVVVKSFYNSSGKLYAVNEYEYDNMGNITKEMQYSDLSGTSEYEYENHYNLWGNLVSCIERNEKNENTKSSYKDPEWEARDRIVFSYDAEYLPLSSYLSKKDKLEEDEEAFFNEQGIELPKDPTEIP